MKILYFLAHPDSIGGAAKVLMTQAYIMKQHNHNVKIVIQNNQNNEHDISYDIYCEKYGFEYESLYYEISTCIEGIDIIRTISVYDYVKNIIEEYTPDIIHTMQLNTVVELVSRKLEIPHIMNIYQMSDGMFNIDWMDVFPHFQSGDSNFYCDRWKKYLNINTRCIRVSYEKGLVRNKYIAVKRYDTQIANIGVLSAHKRQFEVIQFVEQCVNNGFNVGITFLGNDTSLYAQKCKDYVIKHGLQNNVFFTGFVVDIEYYLTKADLLIHFSTCESYPGVIVEAMANKIPVIVTPVAGIPELVKDKKNGLITNGFRIDDLYDKYIEYIQLRNSGEIDQIVENAYNTYMDNHIYNITYKNLLDYYLYAKTNYKLLGKSYKDMRDNINEILDYGKKINIAYYTEETQKSIWFLYHINKIIKKRGIHKATIWGAGHMGQIALEWCDVLGIEVDVIIDCYKSGFLGGIEIIEPSDTLIFESQILFLAMENIIDCENNIRIIEKNGKQRNVDYFLICNNPCIQPYNVSSC